jgi:hypothetical protein
VRRRGRICRVEVRGVSRGVEMGYTVLKSFTEWNFFSRLRHFLDEVGL